MHDSLTNNDENQNAGNATTDELSEAVSFEPPAETGQQVESPEDHIGTDQSASTSQGQGQGDDSASTSSVSDTAQEGSYFHRYL